MNDPEYLNLFFENPSLLLDSCRAVIDHLDSNLTKPAEIEAQEVQLKEISRAIERLEKAGVSVPDSLRGEKTRLAASIAVKADEKTDEKQVLIHFAKELEEILINLKARLNDPERKPNIKASKLSTKRHSYSRKTDRMTLQKHIIMALIKLGGCATAAGVIDTVGEQLEGKFLPGDLELHEDGKVNWRKRVSMERIYMVNVGILKNDSPHKVWELSEEYHEIS